MSSLITIITPVYNAEKYIETCIQSILKQTYQNWELLLVDDCSTDGSITLITPYLKDKRIKLLKTIKNSGPAIARNIALQHAKGDYITFLDSDDIILENKIKNQLQFMLKHKLYITHGNFSFCNEAGEVTKDVITSNSIDYKLLLKGNQFKIMTVMIDRTILENKYFPQIKHEDYQFFLNILKEGYCSINYSNNIESLCRVCLKLNGSVSSNKIKSALWTWNIYYKYQKLGIIKSIFYFVCYVINGIKKYY
ncbi:glycosyltransferase family 2 protein [Gallibacterium trehalosifermentans]|uniref:Glycosyltransferase family 2 protein n=1 Tax=Gallibacterium trehalosifermentans TaxID=516935 RepID=A0ABV6GYB2_9PAST